MTNHEAIEIIAKDALYNPEVAQKAIYALNQLSKVKVGEAVLTSGGRNYNECNVCDFVSVLIGNGYDVAISCPSKERFEIEYFRREIPS